MISPSDSIPRTLNTGSSQLPHPELMLLLPDSSALSQTRLFPWTEVFMMLRSPLKSAQTLLTPRFATRLMDSDQLLLAAKFTPARLRFQRLLSYVLLLSRKVTLRPMLIHIATSFPLISSLKPTWIRVSPRIQFMGRRWKPHSKQYLLSHSHSWGIPSMTLKK